MAITDITNPGLPEGTADTPANRLLLFQTVFSGVVLDAVFANSMLEGATYTRPCQGKKADSFDLVGDATAGYHAAVGDAVSGQDIGHQARIVALDRPVVSAVRVDDWENLVNHFELYGRYAMKLGKAIAKLVDHHKQFQVLRAAQGKLKDGSSIANVPSGMYTAGTVKTMTLSASAVKDASNVDTIANDIAYNLMEIEADMADKEVELSTPKLAIVGNADYMALHQAAIKGTCPWLHLDYKGANTFGTYAPLKIGNITVKGGSNFIGGLNKINTDEGYELYYGDASKLRALVLTEEAVCTLEGMGVQLEKGRDFIHQNDMLIARKADGHETFLPENAGALLDQSV